MADAFRCDVPPIDAPWTPEARILERSPVHESEEAESYDRMVSRHRWLLNRPFVDLVLELGVRRGHVLDIGCGPGWSVLELVRRCPGLTAVGVDPSEDMLHRGRVLAQQWGLQRRVSFMKGRAEDLPFQDNAFDLVISNFVMHHLERPRGLFDEASRLLRPEGRVLIKDLLRVPPWKARFLLGVSKWLLGYDAVQLSLYRESLGAALTLVEIRSELAHSRLAGASVRTFRGLDAVIVC